MAAGNGLGFVHRRATAEPPMERLSTDASGVRLATARGSGPAKTDRAHRSRLGAV